MTELAAAIATGLVLVLGEVLRIRRDSRARQQGRVRTRAQDGRYDIDLSED